MHVLAHKRKIKRKSLKENCEEKPKHKYGIAPAGIDQSRVSTHSSFTAAETCGKPFQYKTGSKIAGLLKTHHSPRSIFPTNTLRNGRFGHFLVRSTLLLKKIKEIKPA